MSNSSPIIHWFRSDLRLEDNPALLAACQTKQPIIPVYIIEEKFSTHWLPGQASNWWLKQSLQQLHRALGTYKSRLIIQKGETKKVLLNLCQRTGCEQVYFNQRFLPYERDHDQHLIKALQNKNIFSHHFFDYLLLDPAKALSNQGTPYKVFTPFWKKHSTTFTTEPPLPKPKTITPPKRWPKSLSIDNLIMPASDAKLNKFWIPGSKGAHKSLKQFINQGLLDYNQNRDLPAIEGTSLLSPHLHFGEISVRKIWFELKTVATLNQDQRGLDKQVNDFIRQLFWRDFAYHLLIHFPHTTDAPLYNKFQSFPWQSNPMLLKAWQQGRTGYPIVDAGMRQLLQSGFMHNRVRMIVASFLTKDLLIPWQKGATWFWAHLVDADLANNTFGWQWTAGCGADASPFFRIFNPITQSQKFDKQGNYIKKWLPELKNLPILWIHTPWLAPEPILRKSKITLGQDYPYPVVEHQQARKKALEIYKKL